MKSKESKYNNIIEIGNIFSTLAVGFSARLVVHFEKLPKSQRPTKHAVAILLYLCDWMQRNNLYNERESDVVGVETSTRDIAKDIGASTPKTVYNSLLWLANNGWITLDIGDNQTKKTVATVNVDKVNQFSVSHYSDQSKEWENIIKKIGK